MKTTIRALRAIGFLAALILIAALVMGCSDEKYESAPLVVDGIDGTTKCCFELLCDEDMDVAYIKMTGPSRGGLTAHLDSTGAPVRCSAIRRGRRRR